MFVLDPRTVIFVNFIYSAFITLFIIFAWKRSGIEFPGLGNWTAAFILLAMNFLILSLRAIIPVRIVIVLPHLLTFAAFIEIKRGLAGFFSVKNRIVTDFTFLALAAFILLINTSNARFRMAAVAGFPMLIYLDTILQIGIDWKTRKARSSIIISMFSIAFLIQAARLILGLLWNPAVQDPLKTGNNLSTISILFFLSNSAIFFALVFIVIQRLLRERKEHIEQLKKASITDELTGLKNRRGFHLIMDYEIKKHRRDNKTLTLAIGDIDFFKDVNDSHGHDCGDFVIREIGRILSENLREADSVARWGGEEFIIILPNTERTQAIEVIDRLRTKIESADFSFAGVKIRKTMSFGLAFFRRNEPEIDQLIKTADWYLYAAKQAGRNRVKSE